MERIMEQPMYVHIGGESCLPDSCVIGVFDLDSTTNEGSVTRDFLARAEDGGTLEVVSPEIPRSFVLTTDRIYLTPVSPPTLRRRMTGLADRYGYATGHGSGHNGSI